MTFLDKHEDLMNFLNNDIILRIDLHDIILMPCGLGLGPLGSPVPRYYWPSKEKSASANYGVVHTHNYAIFKSKTINRAPFSAHSYHSFQEEFKGSARASVKGRVRPHSSLVQGRRSKMGEVDINTLTMEQYLALTLRNGASGVLKPEIGGNVNFEIKSQFMRELREDTFSGNKSDDAHEHVERILDIVSLFNIPGITHDAVMLRILPIILTGAAKRWVDRLPQRTINTWDLLKKDFIQRYC
ncbi:hypothetical protein Tco_0598733 [Tanacetum coccineum]